MYDKKKMIRWGITAAFGAVILLLACIGRIDAWWGGFGGGIIAIGSLRLYMGFKYRIDEEYALYSEIKNNDERNQKIAAEARSITFTVIYVALGIGTILFKILDLDTLMFACAYTLCGIMLVYWIIVLILRRKY